MRIKKLINKKKKFEKLEEIANESVSDQFSLVEKLTLKVVRTGTDQTNFKILEMLPTNIAIMTKELNLTAELVNRFRGTGNVVLTDFGRDFIDTIKSYEELVGKFVYDILKKNMNLR